MNRVQRERGSRPALLRLLALVTILAPRLHAGTFDPSTRPTSHGALSPTLSRQAVEVLREIPEPSPFELFNGDELARALYAQALDTTAAITSQAKSSVITLELEPFESAPHGFTLDLASWAPTPLLANPPPDEELSYPKTRIGAFELTEPFRDGVERKLSLRTHWGCGLWSCELASGDSVNLYGFVAGRPHEATDPLGLCLGLNDLPCSAVADRIKQKFEGVKQAVRNKGQGGKLGATADFVTSTVLDVTETFFVDPLRAGEASGTAIGEGASGGRIALAVVQDVGRAASLAAGAGTAVKVAAKGGRAVEAALAVGDEVAQGVKMGVKSFTAEASQVAKVSSFGPTPIAGAKAAQQGIGKVPAGKTVTAAHDGGRTLSGWTPRKGYKQGTDKVMETAKEIGHEFPQHKLFDQGVPGRYHASHGEPQQAVLGSDAFAVSKEMCDSCQSFMKGLAKAWEKDIVIADPEVTRVFRFDGSVLKK